MPVETSYLPRPSIFSLPAICVSFVSRWMRGGSHAGSDRLQLIDVVEHRHARLLLQRPLRLRTARIGRRRDADERHARGLRAAGVVHGIADVPRLGIRAELAQICSSPSGAGLALDVVAPHDRLEAQVAGANRPQRQLRFPPQSAGEHRELKALAQALEHALVCDPALAQDQAVRARRARGKCSGNTRPPFPVPPRFHAWRGSCAVESAQSSFQPPWFFHS